MINPSLPPQITTEAILTARQIDRRILTAATTLNYKRTEAYLLLLLADLEDAVTSAHLAEKLCVTPSQLRGAASALTRLGLISRNVRNGQTQISEEGEIAARKLVKEIRQCKPQPHL